MLFTRKKSQLCSLYRIVSRIQRLLVGNSEQVQWYPFGTTKSKLRLNLSKRDNEFDFSLCDDQRCVSGSGLDSHTRLDGHDEHKLIIVDILSRTSGLSLRCDVSSRDYEQMCWLGKSDGAVVPVLCKEVEEGLLGSVLTEYVYEIRA